MSERMIRKAGAFEILNHWALALSFFVLALSGAGFLYHLEGVAALFGGPQGMRGIHNWAGVVFAVSLAGTVFNYLGVSLSFSYDDIDWLMKGGGYLSRKKINVPPQDKINTGQKLYYLGVLFAGGLISASGLAIWLLPGNRELVLASHFVHTLCYAALLFFIPIHIYLATLANPGTVRIMISGTVPLDWARKRHAKWVKKMGYE
ncbi:MAG: formate dehydrogenase subunit gamma [Nitrospiraceae bacterium]|nr:formate dehydrogenase subunit gamma [Nitrospiraceae bacterium]